MTFLLKEGTHELECSDYLDATCGLIPLSGPTRLTTAGLVWNLDNKVSEFGGLVSTSNRIKHSKVQITTDRPILWTMMLYNQKI
jgi:thiamine pyrophosphokinase